MASNENLQLYFHYTSKKHLDAIKKSGYIKASDPETADAVFGKGVYLTRQHPTNKKDVAKNNWDGGWEQALRDNKLDYVICVLLPDKDVTRVTLPEGDFRDIYLYKGDLYYTNYKYAIMKWQTNELVEGEDLHLDTFGFLVGAAALLGTVVHRLFS